MRIKQLNPFIGTYPPGPRYSLRFVVGYACACEEGGNGERLCEGFGFPGVIYSLKAIRTARETNLQKAMRSPFPCRKGGRGDRSYEEGEEHLSLRRGAG